MSEKVTFHIHFGDGTVRHGCNRVDLSGFMCMLRGINRPQEAIYESICKWLMRGFRVDADTHGLNLQCAVNRSTGMII